MRAAIYARVSTDQQSEGIGISGCVLGAPDEWHSVKQGRSRGERARPGGTKITAASGELPSRESVPIESVQRENDDLVLQGGQAGRGWTTVISEKSGKITFAVADEGFALLAFGACTAI